jgi:hypothetical protein
MKFHFLIVILMFSGKLYPPSNSEKEFKLKGEWTMRYKGNWQGNYLFKDSNNISLSIRKGDKQYLVAYEITFNRQDTSFLF